MAVEPHLRGPSDSAQNPATVHPTLEILASERAGEYHRHEHRVACATCQFAQDLHAVEQPMIEIGEQPGGDGPGAINEGVLLVEVDTEQVDRREVTDHRSDIVVNGKPVEDRQIEGELALAAPAPDHLGVGGEHHTGRGQPVRSGVVCQSFQYRGGQ